MSDYQKNVKSMGDAIRPTASLVGNSALLAVGALSLVSLGEVAARGMISGYKWGAEKVSSLRESRASAKPTKPKKAVKKNRR